MAGDPPAHPTFRPLGDSAVRISFADRAGRNADGELPRRISAFCARLETAAIPGVTEAVPGLDSVTVFYDIRAVRYRPLCEQLAGLEVGEGGVSAPPPRVHELAVRYGGADGPDLAFVARHAGLTEAEVIDLHARPTYQVALIGFSPGFPYLSGLDPALATPRLERPRASVPAGSVGIGGSQTGVYSIETPGGWRIIGRTDAKLFDPHRDPASLLAVGDLVRFVPEGRPP